MELVRTRSLLLLSPFNHITNVIHDKEKEPKTMTRLSQNSLPHFSFFMLSNKVAIKILQCHFDHCHPFLCMTTHGRARCHCLASIKVLSHDSALHTRWPNYWSFSISPSSEYSGLIPLGLTGLISLQSKGLSRVFSNTTVQKHQFFHAQPSLWSTSHIHT